MRDRLLVISAAVAVGVAALVARPAPRHDQPGLHRWLSHDLGLDPAVVRCIDGRVAAGLLREVDPDDLTADRLHQHGLSAVPVAQRPLVGDVLIGCSVSPETAAGR